jgi:ribosomal protein L33
MICLAKSKSENDFFVAKHNFDKNYFCVTNTTYALSWTTTKVHEKLEQGTYCTTCNRT